MAGCICVMNQEFGGDQAGVSITSLPPQTEEIDHVYPMSSTSARRNTMAVIGTIATHVKQRDIISGPGWATLARLHRAGKIQA